MEDFELLNDYKKGLTERELKIKYNLTEGDLNYKLIKLGQRQKSKSLQNYRKKLGLLRNQIIHHIDLDKSNNNYSNYVIVSNQEHKRIHVELNKVTSLAIKRGIIKFNNITKNYFLDVKA